MITTEVNLNELTKMLSEEYENYEDKIFVFENALSEIKVFANSLKEYKNADNYTKFVSDQILKAVNDVIGVGKWTQNE